MVPNWSRRRLLQGSAAVAAGSLAGCSSLTGSPTATDEDAGTSRYGIRLTNRSATSHEVALDVKREITPEPVWTETVTVEGESSREWDGVITEPVDHQLVARLTEPLPEDRSEFSAERLLEDRLWIEPGSEGAPDVADVQVIVERSTVDPGWDGEPKTVKNIDVTYDGQETPTKDNP